MPFHLSHTEQNGVKFVSSPDTYSNYHVILLQKETNHQDFAEFILVHKEAEFAKK